IDADESIGKRARSAIRRLGIGLVMVLRDGVQVMRHDLHALHHDAVKYFDRLLRSSAFDGQKAMKIIDPAHRVLGELDNNIALAETSERCGHQSPRSVSAPTVRRTRFIQREKPSASTDAETPPSIIDATWNPRAIKPLVGLPPRAIGALPPVLSRNHAFAAPLL